MADIDGEWDCVTETPMGEQKSVFTIKAEGDRFTGSNTGTLGSLDVIDGRVDGNQLIWKMELSAPLPILLTCEATIDGDTLNGTVTAGVFGKSKMSGVRKG